jgi:hypothetical protein
VQVHAEIAPFNPPISASVIVPRRAEATARCHVCDHSFTEHLQRFVDVLNLQETLEKCVIYSLVC